MAEADAPGAEGEGTGQATGAKGATSKLILTAGAVLLIGIGGGGAYFLGSFGGDDHAEAAKHEGDGKEEKSHGEEEEHSDGGALVNLDTFVVNLADEGSQRYLKTTIKVKFFGGQPPVNFVTRRAQIRDLLLTLLSSKYVADVRSIEGKQQLRDEMVARINRVVDADVVAAIYFAEFIVQ